MNLDNMQEGQHKRQKKLREKEPTKKKIKKGRNVEATTTESKQKKEAT